MAQHNEIGKIGEKIAETFLMKHDFVILCKNFRTKFGELDIVAKKDEKIHFVEVKCVKVNNCNSISALHVKPMDNLTFGKWKRLKVASEIYIKNCGVPYETRYQHDLACVYVNLAQKTGKVVLMENVIKE